MILEYACLCLEGKGLPRDRKLFLHDAPYNKHISNLRYVLTRGIRVLNRASKHTFHLLQDTTDPLRVYYIGKWTSLSAYTHFRASEDRTELLKVLRLCKAYLQWQGFFEVGTLCCLRLKAALQRPLHRHEKIYEAPVVSVLRLDVERGMDSVVDKEKTRCLETMVRKRFPRGTFLSGKSLMRIQGGSLLPTSRIEGETEGNSSHVLICGWQNEECYHRFTWGQGRPALELIVSVHPEIEARLASPIHLS
jgi:hypothetical protein